MDFHTMFSPIRIGNHVLKSRLTQSKSGGGLDGSPQQFEKSTRYYTNLADNGAAMVCVVVGTWPDKNGKRSSRSQIEMDQPKIQDGYRIMLDEIHKRDTLCMASLMNIEPQGYSLWHIDKSSDFSKHIKGDVIPSMWDCPTCPLELLKNMVDDFVFQCVELQKLGFDGATFYMCYRSSMLANAISPVLNGRTDEYGGNTLQERARLPLEIFRKVKAACGPDFLIEIQTSAEEEQPGYDVDYWLDFCALCDGLVDIFQIRGWDSSYTHCTGFNYEKAAPPQLQYAEAFKKRGLNGLVAPVGGFGDPWVCEQVLSENRTDLIAMARAWIADTNIREKLSSGHPEDITPCLRCMGKCDFPSCSVNPEYGLVKDPSLFPSVAGSRKKVAVLGGGAAGIRAALTAASRGHDVTLYEKSMELGGQLKHARYPSFKWPLKDYLEWMLRQIAKSSVKVILGVEATPERIKQENYDAIICALGSTPNSIPVPGADTAKVWLVDDVYGHEQDMGQKIVVVGGGMGGRETALYLANAGHTVTLLTRTQETYTDNCHCIYGEVQAYTKEANLTVVEYANTMKVGDHYVIADVATNLPELTIDRDWLKEKLSAPRPEYPKIPGFIYPQYPATMHLPPLPKNDSNQSDHEHMDSFLGFAVRSCAPMVNETQLIRETQRFDCDSVVIAGGRTSRTELAAAFAGLADQIFVVGDNQYPGSIQECTLTGFAAAMAL